MASRKKPMAPTPRLVGELIDGGRWVDARRAIEALLPASPDDHWLLTRLSTTYYEMGDYEKALDRADRALTVAPNCPLALWDRAGALDMLGREAEAIDGYLAIMRRDLASLAEDECGEGAEWAAGLLTDCVYRVACCYDDLGDKERAAKLYRNYLRLLDAGADSIYPREDAAARLRALTPAKDRRDGLRKALEGVREVVGS